MPRQPAITGNSDCLIMACQGPTRVVLTPPWPQRQTRNTKHKSPQSRLLLRGMTEEETIRQRDSPGPFSENLPSLSKPQLYPSQQTRFKLRSNAHNSDPIPKAAAHKLLFYLFTNTGLRKRCIHDILVLCGSIYLNKANTETI